MYKIFPRHFVKFLSAHKVLKLPLLKPCSSIIIYKNEICIDAVLNLPRHPPKTNAGTSPALAGKYQVITETNSPIIENTAEEMPSDDTYPILSDEFEGINLESKYIYT